MDGRGTPPTCPVSGRPEQTSGRRMPLGKADRGREVVATPIREEVGRAHESNLSSLERRRHAMSRKFRRGLIVRRLATGLYKPRPEVCGLWAWVLAGDVRGESIGWKCASTESTKRR